MVKTVDCLEALACVNNRIVEERDGIAISQFEEDVTKRILFARERVVGHHYRRSHGQTENVFVKMTGFFCISAFESVMVNTENFLAFGAGLHSHHCLQAPVKAGGCSYAGCGTSRRRSREIFLCARGGIRS